MCLLTPAKTGFPFPSPGDLPDPGIKTASPILQADSLPSAPQGSPKQESISIYVAPSMGLDDNQLSLRFSVAQKQREAVSISAAPVSVARRVQG